MSDIRQNPYPGPRAGEWFFHGADEDEHGPYPSQAVALTELLAYIHWLEHGPTIYQQLWWPLRYTLWPKIKEFLSDTRGQGQSQGK